MTEQPGIEAATSFFQTRSRGHWMAAMRLLLILALLVALLGFGPSAGAQAHHDQERHASHAASQIHNHDQGQQSERDQRDEGHAIAHVCPGCAFLGSPPLPDEAAAPQGLPLLPVDAPSLRSFDANPIPPPPRLS